MKFINFIYHIICKIIRLIWNNGGGMSEWLKEHAWKVCIRTQKCIKGSNPFLTTIIKVF